MCFPIKVAAIYNATAHLCGMTIHILGGRVCNDVASPLKRTAVDRSCKGVVDNKRHTMLMSHISKALYIEYIATWVRDGFTKESLGVRLECFLYFFVRSSWVDECTINAKLLQSYTKEVEGATIYRIANNDMSSCLTSSSVRPKGNRLEIFQFRQALVKFPVVTS